MSSRKKCRGAWLSQEEPCEEEEDNLLVFGYSCKVFRDDEKALYVEEGKHLIPWMGDPSLLIDRYDGRGYLHDLKQFEAGVEGDPLVGLSEEDSHLEQLCDEERYLALKKSLIEEELYHEEELKRLRAALADEGAYNQVGFSYEEAHGISLNEIHLEKEEIKGDDEEDSFVPLAELNVPAEMEVPSTSKMNAIIEKTAVFVSVHGPQMEIVIKAKQANNTQFAFLAFDHSLNPYYKHMVQAIKMGKYVPQPFHPSGEDGEDGDSDDSDNDEHYLHPSLQASQLNTSQVLTVPKLSYAKTGEDRYSLLVSQLKDKVLAGMHLVQESQTVGDGTVLKTDCPLPPPPGLMPVTLPSYGSDEIIANRESGLPVMPPPELLPIVDKMASYVAKNGEGFEVVVKSKGADNRFNFLKPGHQFYPYYQYKIKMFEKEIPRDDPSTCNSIGTNNLLDKDSKIGLVSFSIKMKEMSEKRNALGSAGSDGDDCGIESPNKKKVAEKVEGKNEEEGEEVIKVKIQAQEARQAEERIRDKLAAAARERLVQVSREKQLQMERKRKAALFLSLLHKGKEDDCNLIGPRLPTEDELEVLVNGEGDLPLVPPTSTMQSVPAAPTVTLTQAITARVVTPALEAVLSLGQKPLSPKVLSSPPITRCRDKSRSRSRSVTKHKRRERSPSYSKERKSHKKKKRRRRRSRSRSTSSHERISPFRYIKVQDHRSVKSSRKPPAAYSSSRNSISPWREFDRVRPNQRSYERRHSRSRSRLRADEKGRRSPSPRPGRRHGRTGPRSRTPSRSRSRSCSRRSRSTSPYRSRGVVKR